VLKSVLKSAWSQCLKLAYDEPLSTLAFNSNMRHYIQHSTRAALAKTYGDPAPAFRVLHLRRSDRCIKPWALPRCGNMTDMPFLSTCQGRGSLRTTTDSNAERTCPHDLPSGLMLILTYLTRFVVEY
jgi:hypothetical protein